MNVLITDAAGFIGSHLSERLLSEDSTIIGLDNFDDFYSPEIKRANISASMSNRPFAVVEGDYSIFAKDMKL